MTTTSEAPGLLSRLSPAHRESSVLGVLARYAPAIALALLLVAGFIASPVFLTAGNIRAVLLDSSILMIIAVGQTFVMSTGGIDLSVSAVAQLSGILLGTAAVDAGVPIGTAILVALAGGALAGALNGLIIAHGRISDFIVTLGTFGAYTGLTLLISQAQPQVLDSLFLIRVATGGIGVFTTLLLIALVIAGCAWVVLFRTPFGTHVLAVGGNRGAADALGLRFTRIKVAVYAISGLLAAVGGVLLCARLGAAEPTAGAGYQLQSIAAAVLGGVSLFGGRSSVFGPVAGAVILVGILNILNITGVDPYFQPIAVGVVVVLSAVLRRFENR
jgi:ribose/xylose/arabinose/galactoside ABC-type transport system permease subunit